MNIKYLIVLLIIAVFVLGCAAKETEPAVSESVQEQGAAQQQAKIETKPKETGPVSGKMILVADAENQRVLEINKDTKKIEWSYGCDEIFTNGRCNYGEDSGQLYLPVSAFYDGEDILVADKGNDRVVRITKGGNIAWVFEGLNEPTFAVPTSKGNVLITDNLNSRVIEVNPSGEIVWNYGCIRKTIADKCASGKDPGELNVPNAAVELENGNILVVDKGNNRVIEIEKSSKDIVFEYSTDLAFPSSAQKQGSGYLITNTNKNKIILVSEDGELLKEISGLNHPTYAGVYNNNYLVTDSFNNRLVEMDSSGKILWFYGACSVVDGEPGINCALGAEDGQLFKPSAAVIK